jgi:hypothetical protein
MGARIPLAHLNTEEYPPYSLKSSSKPHISGFLNISHCASEEEIGLLVGKSSNFSIPLWFRSLNHR